MPWKEVADQLNSQSSINDLVVYDAGSGDELFGCTTPNGALFKYDDSDPDNTAWVQVAPNNGPTSLYAITTYDNGSGLKIYAAGFRGQLLRWNGSNAWDVVAPNIGADTAVYDLCVFNGKLYGCTFFGSTNDGELWEWDDVDTWNIVATQIDSDSGMSLAVYDSELYCGTIGGLLWKWDGTNAWVHMADQFEGNSDVHDLIVYDDGDGDRLYAGVGLSGSSTNGKLFRFDDVSAWERMADQLDDGGNILSLCEWEDKLYGGVRSNGNLYRWKTDMWVSVAETLGAEGSIWSLAVYEGLLYGGTGFHGKLYRFSPAALIGGIIV